MFISNQVALFSFATMLTDFLQILVVTGIAFVLLCLTAGFIRFQSLTSRLEELPAEKIDPSDLLGLYIARLLSIGNKEAPPEFQLLLISSTDSLSLSSEMKAIMRDSDQPIDLPNHQCGFILPADQLAIAPFCERLSKTNTALHFGYASHPQDSQQGNPVAHLIETAEKRLNASIAGNPERLPSASPENETPHVQQHLLDPLTGVLESSRLHNAMQKYMSRWRRRELPVSLLFIDVDNLAAINAAGGQAAGDAVLTEIGQQLQNGTRETDLLGRHDEDALMVMLPCDTSQALAVARRLNRKLSKTQLTAGSLSLSKISASIGVASYPEHGKTPRQLFLCAETALRLAQFKGGGNAVLYRKSIHLPGQRDQETPSDHF